MQDRSGNRGWVDHRCGDIGGPSGSGDRAWRLPEWPAPEKRELRQGAWGKAASASASEPAAQADGRLRAREREIAPGHPSELQAWERGAEAERVRVPHPARGTMAHDSAPRVKPASVRRERKAHPAAARTRSSTVAQASDRGRRRDPPRDGAPRPWPRLFPFRRSGCWRSADRRPET